jgi:hypothetical protein
MAKVLLLEGYVSNFTYASYSLLYVEFNEHVELSQDVNILETFTDKDMKYILDAIYFYIYEELFNFFY